MSSPAASMVTFIREATRHLADLTLLWYTCTMEADELRNELAAIVPDLSGVQLVYLFGSQVDGNLGPMSDYDLAVLVDRLVDGRVVQAQLAHELARVLQTDRVDVVLLNRVPIELAYGVITQGRILYEQDVATRVEYEAYILGRYGDLLPMLRAQRVDILRGDDHDRRIRRYRAAPGRTERATSAIAETHGPATN